MGKDGKKVWGQSPFPKENAYGIDHNLNTIPSPIKWVFVGGN